MDEMERMQKDEESKFQRCASTQIPTNVSIDANQEVNRFHFL